jgi:hypothetical protein
VPRNRKTLGLGFGLGGLGRGKKADICGNEDQDMNEKDEKRKDSEVEIEIYSLFEEIGGRINWLLLLSDGMIMLFIPFCFIIQTLPYR